MNVDRARFLLLTTALSAATAVALSASGCSASDTKDTSSSGNVPTDSSTGDAATDGYTATDAADAAVCLADDGIDPTCEGTLANADCGTACLAYVANYKKGIGRAIVECIGALASCTGAEAAMSACVQGALAKACPDPTAESFCNPLADTCNDPDAGGMGDAGAILLDRAECIEVAKGLSTTGRASFKTCVTDDMPNYCVADPSACIDLIE
jgi:hypothetical protein